MTFSARHGWVRNELKTSSQSRSTSLPAFLQDSEESPPAEEELSTTPATAAPLAGVSAGGSAATQGFVHVIFSSSLPAGTLRIDANRKTLISHTFKTSSRELDETVRLSPGQTKFRVQLTAADGSFHGSESVEGRVEAGQTRTLRVSLFKNHLLAILEE